MVAGRYVTETAGAYRGFNEDFDDLLAGPESEHRNVALSVEKLAEGDERSSSLSLPLTQTFHPEHLQVPLSPAPQHDGPLMLSILDSFFKSEGDASITFSSIAWIGRRWRKWSCVPILMGHVESYR